MNTLSPRAIRTILVAGATVLGLSLAFSAFSVARVLSAPLATAVTVPDTVGFEGYLVDEDTGEPLDGFYDLTFSVYDTSTTSITTSIWFEAHDDVDVVEGIYALELGGSEPFSTDTFDGDRWIGVQVMTYTELAPRIKVSSVPFALNADDADKLDGQDADELVPPGAIVMWSGTSIPDGWALCDGQDGRPDLRGKFVVGYDPADADYDQIGIDTGGEKEHTLTVSEMPAHDHGGSTDPAGAHSHSQTGGKYTSTAGSIPASGSNTVLKTFYTNGVGDHTHGIDSAGGNQPHENRPPYYVVAYIIKLSE